MRALKEQLRAARDARDALAKRLAELKGRQAECDAEVDNLNAHTAELATRKQTALEAFVEGRASQQELQAAQDAVRASESAAADKGDILAGFTGSVARTRDELERLELNVVDAATALAKEVIEHCLTARARTQATALARTIALRHSLAKSVALLSSAADGPYEPIPYQGQTDGQFRRGDDQGLFGIMKAHGLTERFAAAGVPTLTVDDLLALDIDEAEESPSAA